MESPVRKLIPFAGLSALVLLVSSIAASAQSASFTVSQHGTAVGTASFNIVSNASGYDSTSLVHVNMQGLNYALSKTEKLSSTRRIVHVQLSGTVNNSAVNVVAKPNGAQFLVNISANGRSNTTRLVEHDRTIFLPDFDPGALETLLALAAKNNNRELWVVIPKQAGSVEPVRLATYRDERGTLNGKPIEVHHLVVSIAGAQTDLFSGPENHLLQAELQQPGFVLVRNGFVLTPPAKPGAPPQAPAALSAPNVPRAPSAPSQ